MSQQRPSDPGEVGHSLRFGPRLNTPLHWLLPPLLRRLLGASKTPHFSAGEG